MAHCKAKPARVTNARISSTLRFIIIFCGGGCPPHFLAVLYNKVEDNEGLIAEKEATMANRDTATGFGIGFIAGAVVGLAIGFLYAPHPGKETRERIAEKAEEAKDRVAGVIDKMQESAAKAKYRDKWAEQRGRH